MKYRSSFPTSRFTLAGVAVAVLSLAASCTYSHADPKPIANACDLTAEAITYAKVISPIFDANCRKCHAAGRARPDLGDYDAISRASADDIIGSIEHATGFSPMPKGAAKLSDCDILRIKTWLQAGKPNN